MGFFFRKGGQTTDVPIIYLESENIAASSDNEVYKLCCLNAPLKILMICNNWDVPSKKLINEGYWNYIINDFKDENSLTGYFAFIIAEWNENLRFHTFVYDENANLIEDDVLVEI